MSKPRSGIRPRSGTTPPRRRLPGEGSAAARRIRRAAAKGFVPRGHGSVNGRFDRRGDRRRINGRTTWARRVHRLRLHRLRPPAASLPVLVVLVAAVLLAGGAVGYVGHRLHNARAIEGAHAEARAAAGRYAPAILSYDYRHLDRDFAAAKKYLTGGFAKEYATTTEDVVRNQAAQYKAVVKAEPVAVSVVSAEPETVRALLFVNQITTSTRLDGPKTDSNRVLMTLQRADGRWLVSEVDAL
ncbi:MAG: hypothetical protein GEV03_04505 [Streptosporangiales bacterium]|nr:hypothetical protein [Streptosporangiales bacterium]